jgi:hypothetical protein
MGQRSAENLILCDSAKNETMASVTPISHFRSRLAQATQLGQVCVDECYSVAETRVFNRLGRLGLVNDADAQTVCVHFCFHGSD